MIESMAEVAQKQRAGRQYDLEDRTERFARDAREFVRRIPPTFLNIDDIRQYLRSSGSIGANYIEANGALGKKDFLMKIRTCKKESRESAYWLRMLEVATREHPEWEKERQRLHNEVQQLEHIFGAILRNSTASVKSL